MKFHHEEWPVSKLISLYENGAINLSPPYQRNEVWTIPDQRLLIKTIVRGQPIPNFFIFSHDEKYDMVDGQQRSRAILAFAKGALITKDKKTISDFNVQFNTYNLNMTVIDQITEEESIEEFYALVNSAGKKLNKPELAKAKYYDTKFLSLLEKLTDHEEFVKLNLFRATDRMNDIDLVSELVALIHFGISDKKDKVGDLYEDDITEAESEKLEAQFLEVIKVLNNWNKVFPLNETRYKQKNDLYTIFSLINEFKHSPDVLRAMYEWLLVFDDYISPSQNECEPLKEYAENCITQSNSKKARERRFELIKQFLLPDIDNNVKSAIMHFFEINENSIINIEGFRMFNPSIIEKE